MTVRQPSPLPPAEPQYPMCPSCLAEVQHDGDAFYCEDCCLEFDTLSLACSWRNPHAEPCRRQHDHYEIESWECQPCALPADHTGGCWTYRCTPRIAPRNRSEAS